MTSAWQLLRVSSRSVAGGRAAEHCMNWFANLTRPLVRGLNDLSPTCREAARLQAQALNRELPWRQRFGLRLHLRICQWCRRYERQLAFLSSETPTSPAELFPAPPSKLSAEARARLKRALAHPPD